MLVDTSICMVFPWQDQWSGWDFPLELVNASFKSFAKYSHVGKASILAWLYVIRYVLHALLGSISSATLLGQLWAIILVENSFPFTIKQCCLTFTRIYSLLPFHNIVDRKGEDKCLWLCSCLLLYFYDCSDRDE